MADKKISQLAAVTTPLAGTEVLPIVQSSTTKKVSIAEVQAAPVAAGVANAIQYLDGSKIPSSSASFTWNGSRLLASVGSGESSIQLASPDGGGSNFLVIADGSGATLNMANGLPVIFKTGNTERGQFDTSGNLSIANGNLVIGTAGKGIDFSADGQAAGMTSELLDDYEEGTWTPILVGSTSAGTGTYSAQVGTYTKIGNRVNITMFLSWSNHTGTGDASISGLPFATANLNAISIRPNLYSLTASNIMTGYVDSSSIFLEQYPAGGGAVAAVPIDISATLVITAQYGV